MSRRTIAIGDVHGCSEALAAILNVIDPQREDRLILLGDYVDRGPDSRGVLNQLIDLEQRCQLIALLGNHEIMMLSALDSEDPLQLDFWMHCGGEETMSSYGGGLQNVPDDHLLFLRQCHRYFETSDYLFVHANYIPDLPLEETHDQALFWQHLSSDPSPHQSGKPAIVGHTPQLTGEILDLGHVIGIDTFCFGSGWLTALDVDTGDVWQADKLGNLRFRSD